MFPAIGVFQLPDRLAFVFPLAIGVFFAIDTDYASISGNLLKMGLLLLIFGLAIGCNPVRRFLSRPFLFVVGGACYSIYLIHYPLLSAFSKVWANQSPPGGFAAYLVVALLVVLVVSLLFYSVAERPFMTRRAK